MSEDRNNQRRHIRFDADTNLVAMIDTNGDTPDFSPSAYALIVDEAPLGGCGLVILKSIGLSSGDKITVKVGELAPLRSKIVWKRELDDRVERIGVKFLE